jgi:putative solute:sodium symporter small subunit
MAFKSESDAKAYWARNVKLMVIMMIIWFVVSFGFGILLFEPLNNISLGGYKLGFWFAQQGSIYVFVALIFIYANRMAALDREFGVHDD